ncbi:unnamed protein product [Owenia fusiformis]|uniref:Uncharacterized protein n=1 Tax=Owenia fusiformis TaxID=6347 RepID=A0A8J1TS83_OWEFU|nr:unnamed protein product [Owenia fusiformis]
MNKAIWTNILLILLHLVAAPRYSRGKAINGTAVHPLNDKEIPQCASLRCQNGGTCTETNGTYACKCTLGFHGTLCQDDLNECDTTISSCHPYAECANTVGSFTCTCGQDYIGNGFNCTLKPRNVCQNRPCGDNGRCEEDPEHPEGYRCSCILGFTGERCSRAQAECAAKPCLNKAMCVSSLDGFQCLCLDGFKGKLCDEVDKKSNSIIDGAEAIEKSLESQMHITRRIVLYFCLCLLVLFCVVMVLGCIFIIRVCKRRSVLIEYQNNEIKNGHVEDETKTAWGKISLQVLEEMFLCLCCCGRARVDDNWVEAMTARLSAQSSNDPNVHIRSRVSCNEYKAIVQQQLKKANELKRSKCSGTQTRTLPKRIHELHSTNRKASYQSFVYDEVPLTSDSD